MNRFQSLAFRLKFFTLLWIAVSVASIVFTLYLSLWLEGNAAAIWPASTLAHPHPGRQVHDSLDQPS